MDRLGFLMVKLNIKYHLIMGCLIKFVIKVKYLKNHNFRKIRIYSCNSLTIEKVLTFHGVIILIKSVANKNENEYYYNIFLEKVSYKGKSKTEYF